MLLLKKPQVFAQLWVVGTNYAYFILQGDSFLDAGIETTEGWEGNCSAEFVNYSHSFWVYFFFPLACTVS